MLYCCNCHKNLGNQIENGQGYCPKCKGEITNITNQKLLDLITGLNNALKSMEEAATHPKKIIEIAKIIEKGEKTLSKEYTKRIDQLTEIQAELNVIQSVASIMGYNLEVETE